MLLGRYCHTDPSAATQFNNLTINDSLNIRRCSLYNIDACQRIHNQTFLFRLYHDAGFASELNNLLRGFLYAIQMRRRLVIDDQYWNYGSFASFFNVSQANFSPWLPASPYCSQRNFIHLRHLKSNDTPSFQEHLTVARDTDGGFSSLSTFARPLEKTSQTLEMRRIVARYLWGTLNNETKHFIRQSLDGIDIDTITHAMHVRRGDKVNEATLIKIDRYIAGVEQFKERETSTGHPFRVYVASDDSSVLRTLRQLRPQWQFMQIPPVVNRRHGHIQSAFNRLPAHVKTESTRILLTELEILSRAKYVVCTFSSNVCRFVQTLRTQAPDTVLSLDEQWHAE